MEWAAYSVGAMAIFLLIVGLALGEMPNTMIDTRRAANPKAFWAVGAAYAIVAIGCFWVAQRGLS